VAGTLFEAGGDIREARQFDDATVGRITHADMRHDLIRKGRDIDRRVMARAIALFLDDWIIRNGNNTVVF
jgi:formyltetrahydrofolate hydrolase